MYETQYFKQQDGSKIAYKNLEPHNPEDIKNEISLVLIIGLWSVKEEFIGLEEELAKSQKGYVVSSDDPISLDLMAQDTIALIKHLEIKKFNLFGWSMGGCISFYIALNIPSDLKLEKLIICSSSIRLPTPSAFFNTIYDLPKPPEPLKNVQEQKDLIMNAFEKCFTDYMLENPEILDKLAKIQFNSNRPFEIFKRQWEALKGIDIVSKTQMIKTTTLLLYGEADEMLPITEGEFIANAIPNLKFIRIPKSRTYVLANNS
ncbi:3-oxoadipate enol-lactonase [Gigaspora margarita]|uniref:3-oxoadipate enol-lactonase n=1 Tax=Gigaspora margarita TaxID=4874 RepID=A0A8H4AAP4_GIGMA|nr:3-oxoadipate enol-lactonase [Gigaspora margarita]